MPDGGINILNPFDDICQILTAHINFLDSFFPKFDTIILHHCLNEILANKIVIVLFAFKFYGNLELRNYPQSMDSLSLVLRATQFWRENTHCMSNDRFNHSFLEVSQRLVTHIFYDVCQPLISSSAN